MKPGGLRTRLMRTMYSKCLIPIIFAAASEGGIHARSRPVLAGVVEASHVMESCAHILIMADRGVQSTANVNLLF